MTYDEIKKQYPKVDVESIIKQLKDDGYIIEYELT